jgi:hypothetical protein
VASWNAWQVRPASASSSVTVSRLRSMTRAAWRPPVGGATVGRGLPNSGGTCRSGPDYRLDRGPPQVGSTGLRGTIRPPRRTRQRTEPPPWVRRGWIRASCGRRHGDPSHAGPCLIRGAVAQARMQAYPIVEDLQVLEDRRLCLLAGAEPDEVNGARSCPSQPRRRWPWRNPQSATGPSPRRRRAPRRPAVGPACRRPFSKPSSQRITDLTRNSATFRSPPPAAARVSSAASSVWARTVPGDIRERRSLVELLIDRVIVIDGEVEIRYVTPTDRAGEQVRFCHLRLDHRARSPWHQRPHAVYARVQGFGSAERFRRS